MHRLWQFIFTRCFLSFRYQLFRFNPKPVGGMGGNRRRQDQIFSNSQNRSYLRYLERPDKIPGRQHCFRLFRSRNLQFQNRSLHFCFRKRFLVSRHPGHFGHSDRCSSRSYTYLPPNSDGNPAAHSDFTSRSDPYSRAGIYSYPNSHFFSSLSDQYNLSDRCSHHAANPFIPAFLPPQISQISGYSLADPVLSPAYLNDPVLIAVRVLVSYSGCRRGFRAAVGKPSG